jgi:hypothetical protein
MNLNLRNRLNLLKPAAVKYRIRNFFGMAIDWRVRDVLEAERQATIELGRTFVETTAKLTDEVRLLEQRVRQLEKTVELRLRDDK